jgi:site-specific DNA-methyltransferase (adenine-specific)
MRQLADASIDLFFADPPFNLDKDYGATVSDSMKEGDYLHWCREWIDEGVRLLKPGGSFFLYNLPRWNAAVVGHLMESLTFRNWIAIDLRFSLPIAGRLYPAHYSLLYFVKGGRATTFMPDRLPLETCRHCGGELHDYGGYKNKMNPAGVNLADVWTDITPVRHRRFKNRAANELNLKLLDRVIEMGSKPGDIVFDPFGGSGTTYIAAELKGRRWIGTEISTSEAIVARFASIDVDREHLERIRSRLNRLFTRESLRRREKSGLATGKFDISGSPREETTGAGADDEMIED